MQKKERIAPEFTPKKRVYTVSIFQRKKKKEKKKKIKQWKRGELGGFFFECDIFFKGDVGEAYVHLPKQKIGNK